MSSGNPFRASPSHNPASVPQTSFITADSSVSEDGGRSGLEGTGAPPQKTKKHVRITSNTTFIPPHPDDGYDDSPRSPVAQRLDQSEYVNPSLAAQSAHASYTDVFVGQSGVQSSGVQDMTAPDTWASPSRGYQALQSATSPSGVPANPFSRTLASMEPQERDTGEEQTPAERAALGNRASLDVESFKNLLMTGKPGPGPSTQPSQTMASASGVPGGAQFESSSTDTSSISRQSLFESSQHTHAESPRTSFEMAESDEDESMGLVSEAKKGKKKPPPAPKHRHGKLVTQRQPQTVSFESFSASEPAAPSVIQQNDSSDNNKPLPPTPVVSPQQQHISSQDTSQQRPAPLKQHSSDSLLTTEIPKPQKRAPPPVPLARRQSQLRSSTTGNRSRSNSSLTMTSQHSIEAPLLSPTPNTKDPLSVAKSPPPPPRSRHGARLKDTSTSSANSSSTELPQRTASTRSTQGLPSSRRSTLDSESASPARRTSSISSTRIVSSESTGSAHMPPPPPPPRRRQSNRSSLDHQRPTIPLSPSESRRTSTSLENNKRTSVASEHSLRPVGEVGVVKEGADKEVELGDAKGILDDMEKFQREIEELMRNTGAK
ncbi:hypothetical protein HBI59_217120 [Parastagonospora nodorum]|nr:hypothetical protein HBI59_217120 [Parastagonospora nodorum]